MMAEAEKILEKFRPNEPILFEEVLNIFPNHSRQWVYNTLKSLISSRRLVRFATGVYYIPKYDIFVNNRKLSISIASVSLSSAKIHFALNLEDKGTPDDVDTIGLYDIEVDDRQIFTEDNLLDLINECVTRFINELETIEKDISKTKVLL